MPPAMVPSGCNRPYRYSGWLVSVVQTISMAANFVGCFWKTARAMRVADHQLDRRDDRGDGERHGEAEAVVAVTASAQPADRVHAGDQVPRGHVRGRDEVPVLRGRTSG